LFHKIPPALLFLNSWKWWGLGSNWRLHNTA